jgi:peptide-methionine (S)-S-oxide reductase
MKKKLKDNDFELLSLEEIDVELGGDIAERFSRQHRKDDESLDAQEERGLIWTGLNAFGLALGVNAGKAARERFVASMNSGQKSLVIPFASMNAQGKSARATLGGGCFWRMEAAYQTVPGILKLTSGYAGGDVPNPTYEQVSSGRTGHAQVVQIEFDPDKISYEQIIELFWKAHDPTTLNRQGSDLGTQYRSIILYENEAEEATAQKSKSAAQAHFKDPIVTEIVRLKAFYQSERFAKACQRYLRTVVRILISEGPPRLVPCGPSELSTLDAESVESLARAWCFMDRGAFLRALQAFAKLWTDDKAFSHRPSHIQHTLILQAYASACGAKNQHSAASQWLAKRNLLKLPDKSQSGSRTRKSLSDLERESESRAAREGQLDRIRKQTERLTAPERVKKLRSKFKLSKPVKKWTNPTNPASSPSRTLPSM